MHDVRFLQSRIVVIFNKRFIASYFNKIAIFLL